MKRMKPEEMPLLRELTLTYWGMGFFVYWILQTIVIFITIAKRGNMVDELIEVYLLDTSIKWYTLLAPVGIVLSWIAEQYFLLVRHVFMAKGKRYDGKIVKKIIVKSDSGRLRKDRILVIEYDNGKRFKTPRYSCYEGYTTYADECSVYVLHGRRYATGYKTCPVMEVFKHM